MRHNKLGLLLCSGLLACSGRYVSNTDNGAGPDVGAASATGGTSSSKGGQATTVPPVEMGGTSYGGATSIDNGAAGTPPQLVTDAACDVPPGQPAAIAAPITNSMMFWFRLSKLIWADQPHAVPPSWTDLPISYAQAGQIADDAIDQAIAETKSIPGAEPFVRYWLQLPSPKVLLLADWNSALAQGTAVESLFNLRFDSERVGVFSEPAFLQARPSISRRGAVMIEALFGESVPAEPPGIPPFVTPAGLTRREGLAQAVASPVCVACHHLLDPLAFSLEHFDQNGKYVEVDAGQPVDSSGHFQLLHSGGELDFKDIADLGRQLSNTCDANLSLADHFLSFALEQSEAQNTQPDANEVDRQRMNQAFMRSGRTYRSLIKAFAQGQAIRAN